jgi:hypothetical protein
MRSARNLLGAWLLLGGIAACSDHNPTITEDAGTAGKTEAGPSQDAGGSYDAGPVAEFDVGADGSAAYDGSRAGD